MPSKIPQSLYVYYFANYKDCAILKGENKWKCKIGFTRCDVQARIAEQLGTGSPEKPVIALQVETHDAKTLETTVHGILKLRGQYDEEAHGSEWFITNPEEVKEICNFVMKK